MPTRCVKGGFLLIAAMLIAVGTTAGEAISPNAWIFADAFSAVLDPTDAAQVRSFNSATAELFADLMLTSMTAQRTFAHSIPSIVDYSQTAHTTSGSGGSDGAGCYPTYCSPDKKWVMWDTPFVVRETKKRDGGYLGYDLDVGGFATGISRMLGDTTAVGLALGYDYRKLNGRDGYHWRERADAFHAALYGGTALGCFFVDAYAGYSRDWQRTERDTYDPTAGGFFSRNKGNFNNTVLSAGLKASYVWILPSEWRITPAVGLDYSHVRMGSFNETRISGNNGTLLGIHKSNYNSLSMPITVSVNRTFATDFLTFGGYQALWTPEVRGGWVPQFGSKQASVDAVYDFPGVATPFTSRSTPLADSYGTVGAGLKIKLRGKYVFAVDYDYTWASKYSNHTLTGTYGVCF